LSPEDVKISRNRHILTNSDKDNANTSQRQFRPKKDKHLMKIYYKNRKPGIIF
jgi:hypothetical protein